MGDNGGRPVGPLEMHSTAEDGTSMDQSASTPNREGRRPNVVWIVCDQLRADALGFTGNPHVRTPNLDRLAGRGVVFDNLFVQTPVCMGSRACMLTGRYLRTNRMGGGSPLLDPREVTLGEILQHAGYRTGMFGKLHLTPQQYTFEHFKSIKPMTDAGPFLEAAGLPTRHDDPAKQHYGFQDVVGHEDMLWGEYIEWMERRDPALAAVLPRRGMGPWEGWDREFADSKVLSDVGTTVIPAKWHPSMFIGESAAEWFGRHCAEQPCFMEVSFVDPHHPWDPPAEVAAHYRPEDMPMPKYGDAGDIVWPPSLAERAPDTREVPPEQTRRIIAYYYVMIEMIDRGVGRVVEAVEAAGQMDNTLFVFCADHGEFLGDYGLFRKGAHHYDCLIRVPCFLSRPGGFEGGRRIDGLIEEIDLAPTILSQLGLPIDPGMQGRDLSPGLRGEGDVGRRWTFTESYLAWWGPFVDCWTLRTKTAKLNYYPPDRVGHLFDLAADPDERHNVFDDPAHRALRDEMMANLIECLHSQKDPLPVMLSQF